jgi:hypothetical protein
MPRASSRRVSESGNHSDVDLRVRPPSAWCEPSRSVCLRAGRELQRGGVDGLEPAVRQRLIDPGLAAASSPRPTEAAAPTSWPVRRQGGPLPAFGVDR